LSLTFALLVGLSLFCGRAYAESKPYWVFFKDKGVTESELHSTLLRTEERLTPKARARREMRGVRPLVSIRDLPVSSAYLTQIANITGVSIRMTSRWLNAAAIDAEPEALTQIHRLTFIDRTRPIPTRRVQAEPDVIEPLDVPVAHRDFNLDYGSSLRQNSFINAPALHDQNIFGDGVMIGVCDAGFDNLAHQCFNELRIEAAWDFVNGDHEVDNQDDQGIGVHGTRCLSILAGMAPGHLIGIAPHASYVLAKSENSQEEEPVEEDHWIAAAEWMDSLGVDIISSSLGYINWYQYEDLNGETAAITIAADQAAAVGIVVVNAMGNSGGARYPGDKMVAPADGYRVLSIGATNRDSTLAGFSSHGPTYDGRIKPDLVTFGSSVTIALSDDNEGYGGGSGTSFATPAIAGLCALLIQIDPYLTVSELGDLLRASAHRTDTPDTLFGWGIPDGLEASRRLQARETRLLIDLHRGWNTVSINLAAAPGLPFRQIFDDIVERGHLILAKDDRGRFFSPEADFCNIPFWNPSKGYQVGVTEADSLIFTGMLAQPTSTLSLTAGWQIVAYLPTEPMPARSALGSLVEQDALLLAKDDIGRFYIPEFDFCNLPEMRPGRGYHLKLAADATLRYPRVRVGGVPAYNPPRIERYSIPVAQASGMSVLLIGNGQIHDGVEVGVFDEHNKLIGAGAFEGGMCGVAVWSGKEGRPLRLRLFSKELGETEKVHTSLLQGDLTYATDGIAVAEVEPIWIPDSHQLSAIINPNPFNGVTDVSIRNATTKQTQIEVFDVSGRLVLSKMADTQTGMGAILLNLAEVGSGVYIMRISSGQQKVLVRGVLLR